MPFFEIPPERLEHVSLFGYSFIADSGEFAWYSGPRGRTKIEKVKPIIWLDEIQEAVELGAVAVLVKMTAQ